MRQALVVGNWKMNGSRASVAALLEALRGGLEGISTELAVCPTHVHLDQALGLCEGSALSVGAQDCSAMESGAYTGEVSAPMIADMGCRWVILGHSERRQYHGESDELVAAKLAAAVGAGLQPILCVGETREQRERGEAEAVVGGQLTAALANQGDLTGLVVAYEPVWAIGTGLTASPEEAQAMHDFIRRSLEKNDKLESAQTRLLYGGSVKAGNAAELFSQADIDGALVGGASLVAEDFLAIAAAGC